jgi:hypothetical protein
LFPLKKYLVAAAIAALLLLVGGLYYFNDESRGTKDEWAKVRKGERENGRKDEGEKGRRDEGEIPTPNLLKGDTTTLAEVPSMGFKGNDEGEKVQKREGETPTPNPLKGATTTLAEVPFRGFRGNDKLLASFNFKMKPEKSTRRRWGFGVGGGRLSVNSNTGGFSGNVLAPSADYGTEHKTNGLLADYMELRKVKSNNIPYTTDIKHKMPISLGLGVNYYLNNRWTLQSGLVFTMLRSDWTIDNMASETSNYTQRLNYLGIPLSASYRLGQWKRFGFYASAGGMVEYNIDGSLKKTTLFDDDKLTQNTSVKMKEPLFSVNSKIGIVYPVWRFINVYAETGVSYYFDNESYIKTIRSDKPFNVSLQAGISFGF